MIYLDLRGKRKLNKSRVYSFQLKKGRLVFSKPKSTQRCMQNRVLTNVQSFDFRTYFVLSHDNNPIN